ncbi:SusC/RagA family TonB-linked outer membrane protein [Adhaeribacter aerolatus]|uniref:SusC/RagA family TonB-linked outer membrane protein n=1 Tax=Adhaeribacter aerolatus TaxID=670289 RepID=A0A512B0V0_9BACT|nr:TonB-dependent receptor [Adhaeribacter aerolatus]GEO05417.1 SusC/RagA family TonB-linked outer membrane protein [Adhaeribacter aerolatus]
MKNPLLKLPWSMIPIVLCLLLTVQLAQAQAGQTQSQGQFAVSGRITSNNGEALPGVTIVVKGTTIGTTSDAGGRYSLAVPDNKGILVFSFIGFTPKEVPINGQQSLNVTLTDDVKALDEVVVIGYGTQTKRDLTGAVSQVKATQLENENPNSVQDVLRGNVPGLNVGFSASAKGGGSLQVRGQNTLSAGSSPLIVLDGIIYYGALADINPNDIETIDVLKDASSAAVYGAKSASGVVLITTKRGKEGKPVVTFDASFGLATLAKEEKVYGPEGFIKWREDVQNSRDVNAKPYTYSNPNTLPGNYPLATWLDGATGDPTDVWLQRLGFNPIEIENYKAGNTVDWADMVFHNGKRQDYNVSLSGKKEGVSYYMSLGYQDNEGVIVGDQFTTYRSRLNLEGKVNKFLTVGLNTQFADRDESHVSFDDDPSPTYADWGRIINNSPWGSEYDNEGNLRYSPVDEPGGGSRHPFLSMSYTDRLRKYTTLISTIYGKVNLPFGATYQVNFSPRLEWFRYYNHQGAGHPDWAKKGGLASREQSHIYNWQIDNLIKWNKKFGEIHELDVTLLANAEKYQSWQNAMSNEGFDPHDKLGYHRIQAGINPIISASDNYSTGDALMARVYYALKQRYLLTLSVRRDGYSAFGQSNPRATFPAAAFGWIFTDESFVKAAPALSWLNYGKLRFSWGKNGNRDIGRYDAISDLTSGKYLLVKPDGTVYQVSQLYVNRMANPGLRWESTESLNAGLDFGLFNNVIDGSIEAYKMATTDLLVQRALPDFLGFNYVLDNLGEVQNKGIELNLTSHNFERENIAWKTTFNFSLNRNKIVHLYGDMVDVKDEAGNVIGQKEQDDISNSWFIGHAIDERWGLRTLGVWQENEAEQAAKYGVKPGDFKVKDVNGDFKYTNDDKEFLGYTAPRFRWTLRNEFKILKNLDFSFMMYSYWGHINTFNQAKNNTGFLDRSSSYVVPYWTPENARNDYARLYSSNGGASFDIYRKKSLIRLDNIALAYTLPREIIQRASIQNLRLYFTTRNVAYYAPDWSFWDPENSGPTPRTYTLGLNMTL